MSRVICLMTALPPTVGHLGVIRFASEYARRLSGGSEVLVVLSSRPSEPIAGGTRAGWIAEAMEAEGIVGRVIHLEGEDSDPEEPRGPDDEAFWRFWDDQMILAADGVYPEDLICGSERYVHVLAARLGCRPLIYDPDRETSRARATDVRADPVKFAFNLIAPARRDLRFTVTLFGAESVGKTFVARALGARFRARTIQEWARPFLEREADPYPTPERMDVIARGQAAAQVVPDLDSRLVVVRDTDLLSTIGYYRLLGLTPPESILEDFAASRSSLYLMMSQRDMRFEPDPLRYGGDRRESDDAFWVSLLEEFGCEYRVIDSLGEQRVRDAIRHVNRGIRDSCGAWYWSRPRPTL